MNGPVALLLALRYMRLPTTRSWRLFIIPLVPLVQLLVLRVADVFFRGERASQISAAYRMPALYAWLGVAAISFVLAFAFWYREILADHHGWSLRAIGLTVLRVVTSILLGVVFGPFGIAFGLVTIYWASMRKRRYPPIFSVGIPVLYGLYLSLYPVMLSGIANDPRVLAIHAERASAIGSTQWILAVTAVLLLILVIVLRWLTIFTTISLYGMFLGCAALVVVLSVMSGFEADIKHKILGTHAHVTITRPDEPFVDWAEKMPLVEKTPGVIGVSPYLSAEAMIASPANRSNVVVKGIDPTTVGRVTDLSRDIQVGELDGLTHPDTIRSLDDPDDADLVPHVQVDDPTSPKSPKPKVAKAPRKPPPGIILGRELARTLSVYIGDDVSLVSPTGGIGPSGSVPKARPYRVAAIFYSGMFEYDSKFVYITLDAAQKLFDQPDEVTGLEIKVPNADDTDDVVGALSTTLGKGFEVADWKSLNRSLFSALALEKIVMFVFLSFIILVSAFSIVANGQMVATQKTAEIAILKSMGATDGTISAAFFLLGALLGGIGVACGVAGGVLGAFALRWWGYALDPEVFYLTQLPVRIDPHEIVVVAVAGLVVTVAATVFPAWQSSRMAPVEGLRAGGR